MGRPLNKKFFGAEGITGSAWIPGEDAAEDVYILRQKSTTKFLVASVGDPEVTGICTLSEGSGEGNALVEGEFKVIVTPFGEDPESAKAFSANKVKTIEGNQYIWSDTSLAADATGEADVDGIEFVPGDFEFALEGDGAITLPTEAGITLTFSGDVEPVAVVIVWDDGEADTELDSEDDLEAEITHTYIAGTFDGTITVTFSDDSEVVEAFQFVVSE